MQLAFQLLEGVVFLGEFLQVLGADLLHLGGEALDEDLLLLFREFGLLQLLSDYVLLALLVLKEESDFFLLGFEHAYIGFFLFFSHCTFLFIGESPASEHHYLLILLQQLCILQLNVLLVLIQPPYVSFHVLPLRLQAAVRLHQLLVLLFLLDLEGESVLNGLVSAAHALDLLLLLRHTAPQLFQLFDLVLASGLDDFHVLELGLELGDLLGLELQLPLVGFLQHLVLVPIVAAAWVACIFVLEIEMACFVIFQFQPLLLNNGLLELVGPLLGVQLFLRLLQVLVFQVHLLHQHLHLPSLYIALLTFACIPIQSWFSRGCPSRP